MGCFSSPTGVRAATAPAALLLVVIIVLACAVRADRETRPTATTGLPRALEERLAAHAKKGTEDWRRRIGGWARVSANTTSGPIVGAHDDNVTAFLGVPFAAPPVGEGRWTSPKPHAPWSEPRNATWFGPACTQSSALWGFDAGMSEGCLFLNVFAPTKHFERIRRHRSHANDETGVEQAKEATGCDHQPDGPPLLATHSPRPPNCCTAK